LLVSARDGVWLDAEASTRYRTSLAFAAGELRNRLDNVLSGEFLDAYGRGAHQAEAIQSTLFRFAQYFGWSEVVRRYARNPDLRHVEDTRRVLRVQDDVTQAFSTDDYGAGGFMIWRESQRAIGELMITRDGDLVDVMGVAGFASAFDKFRPWMARMEDTIRERPPSGWQPGERERLRYLRAALDVMASDAESASGSPDR
jgi:hypothetical protein